jgi:hypothetical protein
MNMFAIMLAIRGNGPIGILGYVIIGTAIICGIMALVNRKELAELHKADKDKYQHKKAAGVTWKCPKCGEDVEPQFGSCWKCKTKKESQP